ncbi:hypothetical protein [Spiroplasma platyhelix]|uniref:Uncharacterized protein n=1 Tax=Spiroplasma platyhelix PALS-1 TaxID=1276218 RepID=A0A846U2D6_9MOLU|nr:hypothetical protein [Spiroplasma platyhelix]MBE4704307.1 hypothetical protein [Spiroplasma platyhelix PALS-1]NKE38679.1 hypothetical protein [Spiroplasma platyhelix PALS-1]UJB28891.1 hypothetical protein SPLAT_v1c01240 [Spiroplasma platyhelix PALS-1]
MNKEQNQSHSNLNKDVTKSLNEIFEFVDTIDLTNLAAEDIEVDLPNFYQGLMELRAQARKAETKNLHIYLTNPEGETFGGRAAFPSDWLVIAFLIEKQSLKINRITFKATAKAPYLNTILVYYNHPELFPPNYQLVDEIGRINWLQINMKLWESYWTESVKLTYQLKI